MKGEWIVENSDTRGEEFKIEMQDDVDISLSFRYEKEGFEDRPYKLDYEKFMIFKEDADAGEENESRGGSDESGSDEGDEQKLKLYS